MNPDIRRYRTVFFDVGNVLVDFRLLDIARNLRAVAKIRLDGWLRLFWAGETMARFEEGKISADEFHRRICRALGTRVPEEHFWRSINECFHPVEEMVKLLEALKARGYRIFVISNSNVVHGNYLLKTYPFFGLMDGFVWSYEAGARKPKKEIYEAAMAFSRIGFGEGLFFDDKPENIKGAIAAGLDGVLCDRPDAIARYYLGALQKG